MQPRLPDKKQIAEALLSEAASVFVHLDPRRHRVSVPPQYQKQPHLILEIGLNMAVPIRDLAVDDDSITCTLSFNRSPFWCRMPWASVFALVSSDQRGMVWPDDVPREVAFKFQRPAPAAVGDSKGPARARGPRLVTADAPPPEPSPEAPPNEPAVTSEPEPVDASSEKRDQAPPDADADSKRKLPSYLRVVK